MSNNKIVMPPEKKVVDKANNVVSIAADGHSTSEQAQPSVKDRITAALRDMADKIDSGEISDPEFVVIMPKLNTGEIPLIFLGDPIPTVMLEGILHKVLTRMALQ